VDLGKLLHLCASVTSNIICYKSTS